MGLVDHIIVKIPLIIMDEHVGFGVDAPTSGELGHGEKKGFDHSPHMPSGKRPWKTRACPDPGIVVIDNLHIFNRRGQVVG